MGRQGRWRPPRCLLSAGAPLLPATLCPFYVLFLPFFSPPLFFIFIFFRVLLGFLFFCPWCSPHAESGGVWRWLCPPWTGVSSKGLEKVVDARSGHVAETFSRGARNAAFVTEGSPALSRSARESVSH